MNLADMDARKESECVWVEQTIETMQKISKRFTHGKGLDELLDASCKGDESVLRPKVWTETWFSAHAAKVMKVFRNNISSMIQVLDDRSKEETSLAARAELQQELRYLKGIYVRFPETWAHIDSWYKNNYKRHV